MVPYGLRWAGSHGAELQTMVDAGTLTWDDTAFSTLAGIFESGGLPDLREEQAEHAVPVTRGHTGPGRILPCGGFASGP